MLNFRTFPSFSYLFVVQEWAILSAREPNETSLQSAASRVQHKTEFIKKLRSQK